MKRALEARLAASPRKKARLTCEPKRVRWCDSCSEAQTEARTLESLNGPALVVRAQAALAAGRCENFLYAHAAAALGLRAPPTSRLIDLESISSEPEDEAPAPAPVVEEEEKVDESYIWERPSPPPPLVLEPVKSIPDEDALPDETEEEREAYEDRFDRAYGRLCRVPRAEKRELRRRLWPVRGFQQRAVHPAEKRVWMDAGPHKYFIDGDSTNTISMSTYMHHFFPAFDDHKVEIARRCVGTRKYRDCLTTEAVLANWDKKRDNGTAFHATIENAMRVQRDCLVQFGTSNVTAEAPPSFYRFMAAHPFLRPWRCELSMADFVSRICGQADAVAIDVRTGEYWLLDWKNTGEIRTVNEDGAVGTHPLTAHMPDCNYAHYTLQLNGYRHMLEGMLGVKVVRMVMVNFKPDMHVTADPEVYYMPYVDMTPFFALRAAEISPPPLLLSR
jgi:hypothetical protein